MICPAALGNVRCSFRMKKMPMGCGDGKKSIRVLTESCHWSIFCTIFCSFTLGLVMLFWSLPEFRPLGKQIYQPLLKGRKSPFPLIHTQENGYSLCFQGQAGFPALLGTDWEGQKDRSLSSAPSHTHTPFCRARWMERRQQHPPQTRCYSNCSESGHPYAPRGRRLFAPAWLQETPAKQGSSTKKDPVLS